MPKILLIVSAILLLASAGLSYANKTKLVTSLADDKDTHQKLTVSQGETSKARIDQKKAQQDAKDALQRAADAQTALDGAKSQVADLQAQVKTVTDNLTAKDTQLADLNTKLKDLVEKAGANSGGPGVDIAKTIEDLKRQKDELQLVKDSQENQLKGVQAQLAAAQKRAQDIDDKHAMLGLRGQVLAVNREYNFVVLNLGSRNGVSGDATMIVQRGGSMVGRVRTVSVEPSQTVADIVPNSVPAGVVVQPGDTVIFPGS